jgi:hypothetical protein
MPKKMKVSLNTEILLGADMVKQIATSSEETIYSLYNVSRKEALKNILNWLTELQSKMED